MTGIINLPEDAVSHTKTDQRRLITIDFSPCHTAYSYDIVISESGLDEAGSLIFSRLGHKRCIIVTDKNVGALYVLRCEKSLRASGHAVLPSIVVPAGESSKNFSTLEKLLDTMLERGLDRKTLVIALGGGVVGDLSGLAASLVMRGAEIVQIPTTLLAQVDSSVGGKTAIDTPRGKNLVGTFHHPRLVIVDVSLLDTLPLRELKAGYAEVLKYGLIQDVAFFNWNIKNGKSLLARDRSKLMYAIEMSCTHKSRIVARDEKEAGERALLNFGHTFGHALEAIYNFDESLRHGEAVAIGMVIAFKLSVQLGYCPEGDAQLVEELIRSFGMPASPPQGAYRPQQLVELMSQDKKAEAGEFNLILTKGIGQAFVCRNVERKAIEQVWREVLQV